jgi:hypothetical protein
MTLSVTRAQRSPGLSANPYFLYAWHTYQWAVWAPPADFTAEIWTDFTVELSEPDPQTGRMMLLAHIEVNFPGLVSVVYGTRSEAYGGESGPFGIEAGVPVTVECFTVRPNVTYYVNCKWSGALTFPSGQVFPHSAQFGEVQGVIS